MLRAVSRNQVLWLFRRNPQFFSVSEIGRSSGAYSHVFRPIASGTLPYWYMIDPITAVGLVASAAQLAGLVKDVILTLYDYCGDVNDAPKQAGELRVELSILGDLVEWLKEALNKSPHTVFTPPDSLRDAIGDFSSMLTELQTKLLKNSSGAGAGWTVDQVAIHKEGDGGVFCNRSRLMPLGKVRLMESLVQYFSQKMRCTRLFSTSRKNDNYTNS
jgi:hypothetical protein